MSIKRRDFIGLTAIAAASGVMTGFNSCIAEKTKKPPAHLNGFSLHNYSYYQHTSPL